MEKLAILLISIERQAELAICLSMELWVSLKALPKQKMSVSSPIRSSKILLKFKSKVGTAYPPDLCQLAISRYWKGEVWHSRKLKITKICCFSTSIALWQDAPISGKMLSNPKAPDKRWGPSLTKMEKYRSCPSEEWWPLGWKNKWEVSLKEFFRELDLFPLILMYSQEKKNIEPTFKLTANSSATPIQRGS